VQLGWYGGVGNAHARHLRDVHREVTHALEVGDHPERGDQLPEVGRHRLLRGEQEQRTLLDRLGLLVDHGVAGDDELGQASVGVQERGGR
jgi:hypothetical protein